MSVERESERWYDELDRQTRAELAEIKLSLDLQVPMDEALSAALGAGSVKFKTRSVIALEELAVRLEQAAADCRKAAKRKRDAGSTR